MEILNKMLRGEVWWVNFEPSKGGEITKTRPAIIVSNNMANKMLNRLQVVPITSNTKKLYPGEAYVTVGGKQSKSMADQIMTVSKARIKNKIGKLPHNDLMRVENAIRLQLDL